MLFMLPKGRARGTGRTCSGARGGQLRELYGTGLGDVVWLEWGVGAGSLIILTGVLVHRVTRPLRGSVSCGSGWSVPCVSIQLTLSQTFRANFWSRDNAECGPGRPHCISEPLNHRARARNSESGLPRADRHDTSHRNLTRALARWSRLTRMPAPRSWLSTYR